MGQFELDPTSEQENELQVSHPDNSRFRARISDELGAPAQTAVFWLPNPVGATLDSSLGDQVEGCCAMPGDHQAQYRNSRSEVIERNTEGKH
jgi:hypothetical protein